jgi:peptide chain release factor subunit 1
MSLKKQINKLLDYRSDEHPIISLYLRLEPNDRVNFKYKANLKNLIKDLRKNLKEKTFTEIAVESVERDINNITKFIDDYSQLSECRGICIFSSTRNKLWKVFKLPTVFRNQISVDYSPLLGQLIKINDEYKNIVTVLIDRKKARIFRLEPEGCHEILDFFYPEASRTKKFKSTEGKFNQRLSPATGTGSLVQGYGEHSVQRTIDN